MKTQLPKAMADSQRAMDTARMRPDHAAMQAAKCVTSQAAKQAGTSRPAPSANRKGR